MDDVRNDGQGDASFDELIANLFPSAEEAARQCARALINPIVSSTTCANDVFPMLDKIIESMRDEWKAIDWDHYEEDWGAGSWDDEPSSLQERI